MKIHKSFIGKYLLGHLITVGIIVFSSTWCYFWTKVLFGYEIPIIGFGIYTVFYIILAFLTPFFEGDRKALKLAWIMPTTIGCALANDIKPLMQLSKK